MSNEIDTLTAGEIAPFDPGISPLAPIQPDSWQPLTNREIDEYQRPSQGVMIFGQAMPPGTSKQQADVVLGQLGAAFMSDMAQLNYPSHMVQAAIAFMQENATKKPYSVTPTHNFSLHGHEDYLGHAFGNMVSKLSGTQKAKQGFVTACLQWLAKACKQLNGTQPAQGRAPHSAEALLNQLSDSDYNKVIAINNKAQALAMNTLAAKHGDYSVQQVVDIAQRHLESLPANERAHFNQFTTGWVHMMNCVETIEFLYNAAIGAGSIPKDGAGIAREIASIENCMKYERKKYMADPQLQARYRTLLQMKG